MPSSPTTRKRSTARKTKTTLARSRESRSASVGLSRRKNPRLLAALQSEPSSYREAYFENVTAEEVIPLFEESYCSSLVNLLLDLKKSTAKRLFEIMVRHRKRVFLNVFTLYYYKEYLTNPLPLTLESEMGKHVPNHYAILGVPRDATLEELKAAHKLLSSSFGLDAFPPSERKIAEERLQEINNAFEILKNPKRRKALDAELPSISYLYPRRDQSWFSAVSRLNA